MHMLFHIPVQYTLLRIGSEIQLEDKIRAEFVGQEKLGPSSSPSLDELALRIKISFIPPPHLEKAGNVSLCCRQCLCTQVFVMRG